MGAVDGEVEAGDGKVDVQSRTNIEPSIFPGAGKGGGPGDLGLWPGGGYPGWEGSCFGKPKEAVGIGGKQVGTEYRYLPLGVPQPLQ